MRRVPFIVRYRFAYFRLFCLAHRDCRAVNDCKHTAFPPRLVGELEYGACALPVLTEFIILRSALQAQLTLGNKMGRLPALHFCNRVQLTYF